MGTYFDYLFLLLSQFAGGPGPKENNLVRFGLAAILWGVLWFIAWSRQRQKELPREKWLVWGFGLAFIRELFMFSHVSMHLLGIQEHSADYFVAEPLEHALSMAAVVVIAAAFLRYILDDPVVSRRYLQLGLAATGICFIITLWWWPQHLAANPEIKFHQTWEAWLYHLTTSILILIAMVIMWRKQGWVRNVVLVALAFFFLGEFLFLFNYATDKFYGYALCPLANTFHMLAIPILGFVYIRELFIERQQAEEALKEYQNHLEELVDQRTVELTNTNRQLQAEIAERVRIEEALRESEARFRRVVSSVSDHIYMTEITENGQRINRYISPNVKELTGYPPERFMVDWDFWYSQVIHPNDRPMAAAHALHLTMGQQDDIEYRLVRADGQVIWVRDSARVEVQGNARIVYGVVGDITARKQAEKELAQLSHKNELILHSAGEGIFGVDINGNHTFVNPAAANMLGYHVDELVNQPSHATWHHSRPDGTPYPDEDCLLHSGYKTGQVCRGEDQVFWRKDGSNFPVRYMSTPIYEQGELVGAVVVFQDITGRKQAEEKIARRNANLAAQNAIAATISQSLDLDTILNTALDTVRAVLGMEVGGIFLREPDEETLTLQVFRSRLSAGKFVDMLRHLCLGDDISERAVAEVKPVVVDVPPETLEHLPLFIGNENLQTLVSIPLVSESKALGALTLGARRPNVIQPHELELLAAIGQQIGVAVENARLHKQVEWVATLEERQRIAADMHDGLAQTLSYLGHRVDQVTEVMTAAGDQALLDECFHIRHTIDQASRDVRRSIASLQQTPQPSRPFQELLAEVVSDFDANGGAAVDLVTTLPDPVILPPDQIEQVIRVVQEGLLNGRRHAHAEHITLTLARQDETMQVVIEDDGCGFDPQQPPGDERDHFGLKIMRARAARIKGTVQIESEPGRGTRVTLTWPVNYQSITTGAAIAGSNSSPPPAKQDGGVN